MADVINATSLAEIGPESHGLRMTLEEFAVVPGRPGHLYELENGVIQVVDIPGVPHERVKQAIRTALALYQTAHPGQIDLVADGSGGVIRMPDSQSERHPDLLIYLTPPPSDDPQPWDEWVPDIVIEVVSRTSADRDYRVKRKEYLAAGVRLYWIIDPQAHVATVLRRRGDTWREQRLDSTAKLTTPLLPGFELPLTPILG